MSHAVDIDFGWWKRPGRFGVRLSYNVDTGTLYTHTAHVVPGRRRDEVVAGMSEAEARRIGALWTKRGPDLLADVRGGA